METAVKLKITGRVQGVWFRASVSEQAQMIGGLCGWVKNMPDGSVEALVEGKKEDIENLIKWCWEGPPLARVDNIEVNWIEPTGKYFKFGTSW